MYVDAVHRLPDFIKRLRERSSVGRLPLEALVLTAMRSGAIRGACWKEVDLDAALCSIPAGRMKMGRVHHVPLSPAAIDVLRRVSAYRVPCRDLSLPGERLARPLSDMTLLEILRDMEAGLSVYGFRSALRDGAAEESDLPGEVADAALVYAVSNKVEAP